MPIFTTFGGASIRAYGFSSSLAGVFPANTIMLWNTLDSTSVPLGWSRYDTLDGNFIIGNYTAGEVGTAAAANGTSTNISITSTSAGSHVGAGTYQMLGNPSSAPQTTSPYSTRHNASNGAHTHSLMTVDSSPIVPDSIILPAVVTSTTQDKIPANTLVFRKTIPSSGNFVAFNPGIPSGRGQCFYRGGPARVYANSSGTVTGTLNSTGAHSHYDVNWRYATIPDPNSLGGPSAYPAHASVGAHSHTASVPLHGVPTSTHLNCWYSPVQESLEYGMIVMYCGDLDKLPAGWRKCDGTLGTPDLTDRVLGWASVNHGDGIADSFIGADPNTGRRTGGVTSTSNIHNHLPPTSPATGPRYWTAAAYHTNYDMSHSHTITVVSTNVPAPGYLPARVKLAFIQYKGI